jgi:hypothetical protein
MSRTGRRPMHTEESERTTVHPEIARFQQDFPAFWFGIQRTRSGLCIVVIRKDDGDGLHTLVGPNPAEIRAELAAEGADCPRLASRPPRRPAALRPHGGGRAPGTPPG